ncbi:MULTISPECIES: Maf-like protein [unclassified Prevotella]|jgi:septum formation protein|uniref:Maf-like protein n=1 Tax=unclassified Prevotella TaxID=2638335 RepID=UPI000CE9FFE2|nr:MULTISPECIES: Maf-like protein [unclassified Prevotella]MCX4292696.1 Maf-like protein [Prevotella sp.]NPD53223.1 septum formation protein Maf [Prevotella sp. PTAC]GAY27503.1 septum formation protein Maf [Prevotella sp. MGM1]
MLDNLKKYRIVLASNSPRRRELLAGLGIDFEVRVLPDIDESYPEGKLATADIPRYIAEKKAEAYLDRMGSDELIITADTVVIVGDEVLGKPADGDEARVMLGKISGRTHQVVTGVCIVTCGRRTSFSVSTDVTFKVLTDEETDYYISEYRPFDKAGAYGIQEWIGYVGVTGLEGSYFNVMGLPVQRIYSELLDF